MVPVARKLVADVEKLQGLAATAEYQPAQLANGASELLDEVGKSKVTGEEDRYSQTCTTSLPTSRAPGRPTSYWSRS